MQFSSMDIPPGRVDLIPSRVSGRILHYFTPEPLSVLLERCRESADHCVATNDQAVLAMPFLRLAGGRASGVFEDFEPVRHMLRAVLDVGQRGPSTIDCIPLRKDLVFAGGNVASDAHVFADPARIADQMDDLGAVLDHPPSPMHPVAFVACLGFHALHLHPFPEGNGRWARQLVVQEAARRGRSLTGVAHALLLNQAKAALVDCHWPRARRDGLRDYLTRCMAFDLRMRACAAAHAGGMTLVCDALTRLLPSRRALHDALCVLCTSGRLDANALRTKASASRRVVSGCLEQIASIGHGVDVQSDGVEIHALLAQAARDARVAIDMSFGDV